MSKLDFRFYIRDERDVFEVNDVYRVIRSGGSITWSWGMSSPKNFHDRALTFSVNGFKHKGIVAITYNRVPDLFNVELRNRQYNLVDKIDGVYIDQLVQVIDSMVETDNDKSQEYKGQVENATYNI